MGCAYLRVTVGEDQLVIDCHCFPLCQCFNQQLLFDLKKTHRLILIVADSQSDTVKHGVTWKQGKMLPLAGQRVQPGPLVVPHPNLRLDLLTYSCRLRYPDTRWPTAQKRSCNTVTKFCKLKQQQKQSYDKCRCHATDAFLQSFHLLCSTTSKLSRKTEWSCGN